MSETDLPDRVARLEAENARLRGLLEQHGMPGTLRHQVRHALGLMRAILRHSAQGKTTAEDLAAHLEGRFDALLRVQTLLLASPDSSADFATLAADTLLVQTIQEGGRATVSGPQVRIGALQAELLGLVLHELATNSVKFGALTVPDGHIDLSWSIDATQDLTIVWAESGRCPGDLPSTARGFGMEAIEGMLPTRLKAKSKLELLSEGLRCTIILPLAMLDPGANSSFDFSADGSRRDAKGLETLKTIVSRG